ncbi:MAG: tripartite tricarboxylate transporter substrate binding protein [Rubrivivax sp.]|nr:tripartite tricarboxylate transporter substrate binding protein [Rubrivivax sp.]
MDRSPHPRPIAPAPATARLGRRAWLAAAASTVWLPMSRPARAQGTEAWPSRPLRVIVGYPAGGLADALARAYGEALAARLGQPVLVENKPGAAGMLAGGEVARAAPDGHTLWLTLSGTLNQNRVLYRRLPYDPDRDFVHVAGFDPGPSVLAVPAAGPRSWAELVERARRERQTFGNYAQGSLPHMMARQLADRHGLQVDPVPYRGEAPMWTDLAGGQISMGVGSPLGLAPFLAGNRVRALAVTTRRRAASLPDVPTFDELGFSAPVFTVQGWIGLLTPARTPAALVQRLSDAVQEAAAAPRVQAVHRTLGLADKPWPAAEFERLDRESRPWWIDLARELKLTLD